MERQFLCFLHGDDESALLRRVADVLPGVVAWPGRYASTGDVGALLEAPARHRFVQALRSERRLYLAHPSFAAATHLEPLIEGPHAGLFALDPLRSEVLELALRPPHRGRLPPARLAASVVRHEGLRRVKKSAAFGTFVARVLRELAAAYPVASVDYLHVAPGALAFAAGGGRLTYLEEEVLPAPFPGQRRQAHKERIVD